MASASPHAHKDEEGGAENAKKTADDKPEDAKSVDGKPEVGKPEDGKPKDAKPEDTKPEDAKPKTPENPNAKKGAGGVAKVADVVKEKIEAAKKIVTDGEVLVDM